MEKITPFLWFDTQAEEAARFYVSVFAEGSRVLKITHYGEAGPGPKGSVMTVEFELRGQRFVALNGGPRPFHFNEAVSFVVNAATQAEADAFWKALSAGGEEGPCGWLKDRYGLSWQVVPKGFVDLLTDPDPARSQRAMAAMMKMTRLDIEILRRAAQG